METACLPHQRHIRSGILSHNLGSTSTQHFQSHTELFFTPGAYVCAIRQHPLWAGVLGKGTPGGMQPPRLRPCQLLLAEVAWSQGTEHKF